jgi:predicted MFS family arabinose efflux permease
MPSFQSIVPSLVTRPQIGRGLALNSTQFNLSRILGPSIAGVLIAGFGAMACFVVSAASYIPFIGVALWILPRRTAEHSHSTAPPRGRALVGIGGILREGQLRGALLTVLATSVLCSPLVTFSPVLVKDVFRGDAGRFSLALAAFGVGGLLGAVGLLGGGSVDQRRLSSGFAVGYGVVLILTALNPWFWGLPPLLVFAGASMTVSNTAANSLLQARVSPHLLGQTVSLYMLAMRGGISLGAVLTGATVSALGVQHALLLNGVLAVVVQGLVARAWLRAPAADTASSSPCDS